MIVIALFSLLAISEYLIEPGNPLVGKMLRESRPWDFGVIVLAIRRNDVLMPGIPGPSDRIESGDDISPRTGVLAHFGFLTFIQHLALQELLWLGVYATGFYRTRTQ